MPKNCGVGWPEKVVSCSEDEKGVQGGSGAYMNQVQRFSRGISGLVVEYIVAIDVTRARFPADALLGEEKEQSRGSKNLWRLRDRCESGSFLTRLGC